MGGGIQIATRREAQVLHICNANKCYANF